MQIAVIAKGTTHFATTIAEAKKEVGAYFYYSPAPLLIKEISDSAAAS